MTTLTLEVSPTVEVAYRGLAPEDRQQIELELAFRIGQYSRSSDSRASFFVALQATQQEAADNGATTASVQTLRNAAGHGE